MKREVIGGLDIKQEDGGKHIIITQNDYLVNEVAITSFSHHPSTGEKFFTQAPLPDKGLQYFLGLGDIIEITVNGKAIKTIRRT